MPVNVLATKVSLRMGTTKPNFIDPNKSGCDRDRSDEK
jgi:hypothetical protein